ncbi:11794_t:CDS:2 [Funneliformis geosporum]|uniref:11794_t:CDS:1 n=1 Tax=Funneliformis geosporum TaxID=1117311 RepID=A0A9W4SSY0_9GLOM|nr:11794_t:CDS:2 [Funneliformis geosporum]
MFVQESFRTYPVHRVAFNPRGYRTIKEICIHWYDYTQKEKWTDCNIATRSPTSYTSPDWSVGYKLSIHSDAGTFHEDPILWWDDYVGVIYCNDIHFYLSGINTILNFKLEIVTDKCFWE